MSHAITSGSFHEPLISRAVQSFVSGLFSRARPAAPVRSDRLRVRAQEAEEVRDLARSVERQSPGFAADLYAAALRHEALDD